MASSQINNALCIRSTVDKLTKRYILQTFSIFFEEVTELRHGKPHPVIAAQDFVHYIVRMQNTQSHY